MYNDGFFLVSYIPVLCYESRISPYYKFPNRFSILLYWKLAMRERSKIRKITICVILTFSFYVLKDKFETGHSSVLKAGWSRAGSMLKHNCFHILFELISNCKVFWNQKWTRISRSFCNHNELRLIPHFLFSCKSGAKKIFFLTSRSLHLVWLARICLLITNK